MSLKRYLADPALADFVLVEGAGGLGLVRRGYEASAGRLGLGAPADPAGWVAGGRAAHPVVALPGGERVVVRAYRRGGLLRHLNRGRYFVGHRALDELRATECARRGGVRVPVAVAAVERAGGVGYTASLCTRWIEGAVELADWRFGAGAEGILRETGRQIALMHRAGIGHPDLNLRNVLVAGGDGESAPEVYLLDFDRASVLAAPVPWRRRARDLRRLARSARKLGVAIDAAAWRALREGYGADWPLTRDLG